MLHIVSTSSAFKKCRKYLQKKDNILVLKKDILVLYHIQNKALVKNKIQYSEFVELLTTQKHSITWQ